jgi:hypothetical protein
MGTTKKYHVTFRPEGTRSKFVHREYSTREEAQRRVDIIKKIPLSKRTMINPRVCKNPFYKG